MPTYNYLCKPVLRRLDLAAMYICKCQSVFVFSYLPPLPTETAAAFLICPFQRVFTGFHLQFQKERKKKGKKKKCIVSCRVVSLTLELGIVLNACRRYDEGKKNNNNQKKGGHIQESNRVEVLTTLSPKKHRSRERGSSTRLFPLSFILIIILIHQKREKGVIISPFH